MQLVDEILPPGHRSGFISIIGRPNVGKSTLLNHFLGQKIAIISPKPQTTRNRLLGILNFPSTLHAELSAVCPPAQLIFVDTPGIHLPQHKLGEFLVAAAKEAIPDADVVIWLVDGSEPPNETDKLVADMLHQAKLKVPVIMVLNKVDILLAESERQLWLNLPGWADLSPAEREQTLFNNTSQPFLALYPATSWLPISALKGNNRDNLLKQIIDMLPLGPRYFPEDQVTDQQLRFIAGEMIREAALYNLEHEVPHSLAIVVDEYKERSEQLTYIGATIIVERDTHKKIVIGKEGRTLKQIGQRARREIESLTGTKVFLELWVKVSPHWRAKASELERLGYARMEE